MYTVVFVDGQPQQIKIRFMIVRFSSLCIIITSETQTIKTLIKILINTGNQ